jgi:septal ring factor EnvC (AmiA/AmiB activator)
MMESQRFWFVRDPYAWIVLVLGVVTAVVIDQAWVVLLGVSGYLFALLVEVTRGRSLGHSGAIRLARAEQEVRELQAERARLLGALQDMEENTSAVARTITAAEAPDEEVSQDLTTEEERSEI